jgi:hypothetical protein
MGRGIFDGRYENAAKINPIKFFFSPKSSI